MYKLFVPGGAHELFNHRLTCYDFFAVQHFFDKHYVTANYKHLWKKKKKCRTELQTRCLRHDETYCA